MDNTNLRTIVDALELAERYLRHPDVQKIPFAVPASLPLKRVRAAIASAGEGTVETRMAARAPEVLRTLEIFAADLRSQGELAMAAGVEQLYKDIKGEQPDA